MKRTLTCFFAFAVIVLSLPNFAAAFDMKVQGVWDFGTGWASNLNFLDKGHKNQRSGGNDPFIARHRIRTQTAFIVSESLSGVLMFEIGNIDWGRARGNAGRSSGGALDADGVNIETKRAYLDWAAPNTGLSARMGIQSLNLPMATGYCSPVMYADVAGVNLSYTFNTSLSASLFWARPFAPGGNDGERRFYGEMDMFAFTLPFAFEGFELTPWAMYAKIDAASGYYNYIINYQGQAFGMNDSRQTGNSRAWWAGASFDLSILSPLTLKMDVMYGDLRKLDLIDNSGNKRPVGTKGWYLDGRIEYQFNWGSPGLFGWWSSGDSANADRDGEYGRIPVVGVDGCYGPTSFGLGGTAGLGVDGVISPTGAGTWGAGLQVSGVKFLDSMTHTLRVVYYEGTNSSRMGKKGNYLPLSAEALYLTDKDRVFEVNFDHTIKIHDKLSIILETGYIHIDLDGSTWDGHSTPNKGRVGSHTDDAWKAQLLFKYRF